MASAALTLEHVSRHFGGLKAVDDVSMVVQPGERRALIGPNGAGKTTLFNVISGELPASGGRVERVNGELQNTVIDTFPRVSQFWKYNPADYLKQPLYSRRFVPPS